MNEESNDEDRQNNLHITNLLLNLLEVFSADVEGEGADVDLQIREYVVVEMRGIEGTRA